MGKTTLAHIVAKQSGRQYEELSAVTSGVKDLREVLRRAHERLVSQGKETVLFIDEVHRFSKSQQDALLPSVENRDVTFIAATTENPSFSVIKPLLSRSVVVKLESLEPEELRTVIERAVSNPRGLGGKVRVQGDAVDGIIRLAGGDARKSLTTDVVSTVMDVAAVRYDRNGDDHYDVISAFIKSMRGSDVDATLHYLARMIRAGEDPRFIARRIMIAAAEEVGMAAPQILQITVAAAQAVQMIGMPEARIILSEAAIAVATAPKSNASYTAINQALADVDAGLIGQVPLHIRNAPTTLMKSWGNHEGYHYAHDYPNAVVEQQYMPDVLVGREYYHPNSRGYEREIGPRLDRIRAIIHGEPAPPAPTQTERKPTEPVDPAHTEHPGETQRSQMKGKNDDATDTGRKEEDREPGGE